MDDTGEKEESGESSAEQISRQVCQRIRDLRQQAGWSLDVLSKACGVSRSMLSQIEREQANPTLAVTVKIASAFGLNVTDLFQYSLRTPNIDVVRAADPSHIFREDPDCTIRTLSPLNLEKDVELYEVRLMPEGTLESAPHFEGTREFLTVQKGSVRVISDDEETVLARGDSASYKADVPHQICNDGRGEASVILVVIYR